jgi:hypothetical protein
MKIKFAPCLISDLMPFSRNPNNKSNLVENRGQCLPEINIYRQQNNLILIFMMAVEGVTVKVRGK